MHLEFGLRCRSISLMVCEMGLLRDIVCPPA